MSERSGVSASARGMDKVGNSAADRTADTWRQEPASLGQQRLWLLDQLVGPSATYNVPIALRLDGKLDTEALEGAITEIVRRHEVLRTTIGDVEGVPVQVIARPEVIRLKVADLSEIEADSRETECHRILVDEAEKPFRLGLESLFRPVLVKLGPDAHVLALTMHHAITDGWSLGVFCRELATLYAAFHAGRPSPLAELTAQYSDFVRWQREWLTGDQLADQLAYWRAQLRAMPEVLVLPTDRPRPPMQSFRGSLEVADLPTDLMDALRHLSREAGVTLFMTVLAAFQVLLHLYTGQTDIAVGSPIANRRRSEFEELIGYFVNNLVLRTDLSGNPTFRELLGRVREVALGAYGHQDLPFERIVEELRPRPNLAYSPVFQVLFVVQPGLPAHITMGGLTLALQENPAAVARTDLTLLLTEHSTGCHVSLEYNSDLFDAVTARRCLAQFKILLEVCASDPAHAS